MADPWANELTAVVARIVKIPQPQSCRRPDDYRPQSGLPGGSDYLRLIRSCYDFIPLQGVK